MGKANIVHSVKLGKTEYMVDWTQNQPAISISPLVPVFGQSMPLIIVTLCWGETRVVDDHESVKLIIDQIRVMNGALPEVELDIYNRYNLVDEGLPPSNAWIYLNLSKENFISAYDFYVCSDVKPS